MQVLKKHRAALCFLAALLVAAVALGIWANRRAGLEMENNATMGLMPGVDMAARLAQLQEELDESKIAFSINTAPLFAHGAAQGNLLLENPSNNNKLITAEIVLDETQETLYQSKALPPGSYLQNVTLSRVLPKGDYAATVYLRAYRLETQELIGQTGAAVTLTVQA